MSTSNQKEAHNFYYEGVDGNAVHAYSGCSLHYSGNVAYSYSTVVAKVIPKKGYKQSDVKTSSPETGMTLVSMHSMTNTTGRHISLLAGASPFHVVHVPMEMGEHELTPQDLADNIFKELEQYVQFLNTRDNRATFFWLMEARKTILRSGAEEWAKPLRDKRFARFDKIDVDKVAKEIQARNRKAASKKAAETKALFAKYVKDRHGADYCEFVRAVINGWYDSKKYPFTNEERRMLQRKLDRDAAYVWTEGDAVVTSRGVRVGVDEAKVLLKAWAAGRDMRGLRIGCYTIVSYTGDTIKIGCHRIPRENMIALYEALIGKPFPKDVPAQPTEA